MIQIIVAIHQPNYLPYLGFFDKIRKADIFVIYDDAQFNKEDFQHRNKIRIYHGWKWLTVPVEKRLIPINEVKIDNKRLDKKMNWSEVHIREIRNNYYNSRFYGTFEKEIEAIYMKSYDKLIDINMEIIRFIMRAFDIKTRIIFSSQMDFFTKSTERLVDIVEKLGGDTYLSGPSGRYYLNLSLFEDRNISVKFQNFKHPVYEQCYDSFIPNMSAIDILFNFGKFKI